ncbi:MAG: family 10 glycosylhydrolase [Bacteroidaceae bacterium]|nr:family 10 glycosylhydrolase [Bacteroidaceae bacterium]
MKFQSILLTLCMVLGMSAKAQPKREFRGAWIQCVNGQFQGMGTQQMQETLTQQLDELQRCGINAILFQVRPEGDALYASRYEPWSRFLTGVQGQPPSPYWDPLQWMVDECHKRGLELHAWLNPYRAKTKTTNALARTHAYQIHPERCFWYDDMILFDPGQEVNRRYFCQIIKDILDRYDVDGIHIDDYFYPYPVAGKKLPDMDTYAANPRGFGNIDDWRRDNVNLLIKEIHELVCKTKPWVKFGVSPFGIYRNRKNDPNGSDTNGTQNYDDLYADILKWVEEGWVDYNIPQIYWEIGHKAADYDTLIRWWSSHAGRRPLFIGQDVERTVKAADPENPSTNQMPRKYMLQRMLPNVAGSCQWPASSVVNNSGNYGTMLKQVYHATPALQPLMPFIDNRAPGKVKKAKVVRTSDGPMLFWTEPSYRSEMDRAARFVVYRFKKNESIDLEDPAHIVAITPNTYFKLPPSDGSTPHTYVITALDRLSNESRPVKRKVKL